MKIANFNTSTLFYEVFCIKVGLYYYGFHKLLFYYKHFKYYQTVICVF